MHIERTVSYQKGKEIRDYFSRKLTPKKDASFSEKNMEFNTELHAGLRFREGLKLTFPIVVRLYRFNEQARINWKLKPTKLVVPSIISAVLMGAMFFWMYKDLKIALIGGAILGIAFYLSFRNLVWKAFKVWVEDLMKRQTN